MSLSRDPPNSWISLRFPFQSTKKRRRKRRRRKNTQKVPSKAKKHPTEHRNQATKPRLCACSVSGEGLTTATFSPAVAGRETGGTGGTEGALAKSHFGSKAHDPQHVALWTFPKMDCPKMDYPGLPGSNMDYPGLSPPGLPQVGFSLSLSLSLSLCRSIGKPSPEDAKIGGIWI